MSRSGIMILVCVIAVLAVFVAWNLDRSQYNPSASYQEKFAYWKTRIHAVGGGRAYEEMALELKGFVHGMQHYETHLFASALYSEEGIHGVAVCDERFDYACVHQLVAEALLEHGIGSLNEIIEVCNGGPACRHSIGHGVLALMGYTFPDLEKAVSMCAALPNKVYVQGCYGGVVMEYNLRRLLGDAQSIRTIGEDWFEPCDQLSKSAQRVCYFWQPMWWKTQLSSSDQSLSQSSIEDMGELCLTILDKDLRNACIEGVGMSVLNAARTTNDGVSACAYVSPNTRDQALCSTSIARLIELTDGLDGHPICFGTAKEYQESCLRVIERASPEESYLGEAIAFDE
jgi:hypothetical protein